MKFATKLTLLFAGIFLAVSVIANYTGTVATNKILEDEIGDKLEEQAFNAMDKIDRILYLRMRGLTNFKTVRLNEFKEAAKKRSTEPLASTLKGLLERSDFFTSFSFFDMDRVRLVDTLGLDIGKRHGLDEYWPEIEAGKDRVFDMYTSESAKTPQFHFAQVIKDETGKPIGVFVARTSGDHFNDITELAGGVHPVDKAMVKQGLMKVDMVNKDGVILYSNHNQNGILKDTVADWEFIEKHLQKDNWLDSRTMKRQNGKDEMLVWSSQRGYKEFKGNGWTLLIHLPAEIVLASSKDLENKLKGILLFLGLASSIGMLIFSRTVSKPIAELERGTREIRNGNLDVKLAVTGNDEIARLAESFNLMAEQVSRANSSLNQYAIQLKNEKEKAEEATKLKDKFVSLVSHDLKSPITNIYATLKLTLSRDANQLPKVARENLASAIESCWNLNNLIDGLLDIGMFQTGRITPQCEFVDTYFIAVQTIMAVESRAKGKGIKVINNVPKNSHVFADPLLLSRIVQNLLTNAVKFCSAGDEITVSMPKEHPSTIVVADTGIGIEPDVLATLFDYGHNVSHPGTAGEKGTGLGLPLSNEIAKAMGGSLKAESAGGKGSAFYVELPLVRCPDPDCACNSSVV